MGLVYSCEPRGPQWSKWSPIYRGVCIWLYPLVGRIVSWDHIFQLLEALFPGEDHPSEDRIRQWYQETPDYAAQLQSLGFALPGDFIQQRRDSDPEVAKKMTQIGLSKPEPKRQIKPCEIDLLEPSLAPTTCQQHCEQPRPSISGIHSANEAISMLFDGMAKMLVLIMVAYSVEQLTKLAIPRFHAAPQGFDSS